MRGIPIGAGSQFTKGLLLIFAAVVLGIVLLQVVDDGSTDPVASRPSTSTTSTTKPAVTTTTKPGKTTSTTAKLPPQKTPAQVKLLVLNAGAPDGSAVSVSNTLKTKGYTNQGSPSSDPTHVVGNKVLCTGPLGREAALLVTFMGAHTTKGTLGNPAPPGSAGFDCVVLVGASG
jgi:hypothetical protein